MAPLDIELTETKKFALDVLACFDELAKPEISNSIMVKIWDYVRNRTFKIILRKPDEELKTALRQVYEKLGPMFADVDLSEQIRKGEELGSPPVPDVGDLARVKKLTNTTQKELLEELGF